MQEIRSEQRIAHHRPELSVVATMYKSEDFIPEFHRRVTETAKRLTGSYEIVLVNDGSPDRSQDIAVAIAGADPHVRVVELSRNFGHHTAMLAGLRHAMGDFVFLIDIDLEEQPEWLFDFWQDLHETRADIIYGVQTARPGSLMKRYSGSLFYKFFNLAADTAIPVNGCTVRIMKRCYVDSVSQFAETHVFMMGLFSWSGFTQRARHVTKIPRNGKSTYTPIRLIRLAIDAITSFSSYPLTIIFVVGICITLLSLGYACVLITQKLRNPDLILSGFTSIMVSLWLIGGAVISVLGLIGMYIGKIFTESKCRPQYFVRSIYERRD